MLRGNYTPYFDAKSTAAVPQDGQIAPKRVEFVGHGSDGLSAVGVHQKVNFCG